MTEKIGTVVAALPRAWRFSICSIEHESPSEALGTMCMHKTYVPILEDSYTGDTVRVDMDNDWNIGALVADLPRAWCFSIWLHRT